VLHQHYYYYASRNVRPTSVVGSLGLATYARRYARRRRTPGVTNPWLRHIGVARIFDWGGSCKFSPLTSFTLDHISHIAQTIGTENTGRIKPSESARSGETIEAPWAPRRWGGVWEGKYGTGGNNSHSPGHSVVCINDVIATRDFFHKRASCSPK